MSRLAVLAEAHWKNYLPVAYASIPNRTAFFAALEADAEIQIADLADDLRGPAPASEPFAARMSRFAIARSLAESQVLRELILLPAEREEAPDHQLEGDGLGEAISDFRAARKEFYSYQE